MSIPKKEVKKMDKQTTVTARFEKDLYQKMQRWLQINGLSANQLLTKAVESYISEDRILIAVPLSKTEL